MSSQSDSTTSASPSADRTAGDPTGRTGRTGRQFTEPLRELCALALVGGNAVFLFLGFTGLFFVIDGWASGFGQRCAALFGVFVGPVSLGLPIVAVLLATHVSPMVPRHRLIVRAALIQYAVSAVLGFAALLGAFANDVPNVRAALEGLLGRAVWLGFLALGGLVLGRLYVGLVPGRPQPVRTPGAGIIGRQYGGASTPTVYQSGSAAPRYDEPTVDTGWPVVPPPPKPAPIVVPSDATVRVVGPPAKHSQPTEPSKPAPSGPAEPAPTGGEATQVVPPPATGGEATQVVPPPPARPAIEDPVEPPTGQFNRGA